MAHKFMLRAFSILPALVILPAAADVGPIATDDMVLSGTYENSVNDDASRGGAYTVGAGTTGVRVADHTTFINNVTSVGAGGALKLHNGIEIGDGVNFTNNRAEGEGWAGGAMHIALSKTDAANQSVVIGTDSEFRSNRSDFGGAIAIDFGRLILDEGAMFANNTAIDGGAIAVSADTDNDDLHSTVMMDDATFRQNSATAKGGAILNSDADATVLAMESSFDGNRAANGGAIYNTGRLYVMTSEFDGNTASKAGGAIFNDKGGNVTLFATEFKNNVTDGNGGAIYNDGGTIDIERSSFVGNSADKSMGGAIFSRNGGHLTIRDSEFANNSAMYYGALSTSIDSSVEIMDTVFMNNSADEGGAMGLFNDASLTNVKFIGNSAQLIDPASDGAGAVFLGAGATVRFDNASFTDNESGMAGGAISTRAAADADNSMARLDIKNSEFIGNHAMTNGGALNNFFYASADADYGNAGVMIDGTRFVSNSATKNGGAIYNHGELDKSGNAGAIVIRDSVFSDNKAAEHGGAIYNAGTIVLRGQNVFSGNMANGVANDIYNTGDITIADGETVIGGGIDGDGILTLNDGATLNLGTNTVTAGTLSLNGTILAAIDGETEFGRLYAESITGTGTLKLTNIYDAGTYQIFNVDNDLNVDAGFFYSAVNNGADGVVISVRSPEEIASASGVDISVAAMVIALQSRDDMSDIALRARDMLINGEFDELSAQVGRANPDRKPVMHSVSTGIQNQILNTTANRMSASGRAGGDMSVGYGAWGTGLLNKSKFDDRFHAYSRGVALGADALVNRVFTIGAGYAYNNSDVHGDDRTVDIDASTLFIYGQYKPSSWYANTTISYTMADYEENTTFFGMPLSAEYDVDSFGAQIATGYDFASGVTPEFGVRYLHMAQDDYSNGLLRVRGTDSDYLGGVAGVKYAFDIMSPSPVKYSPELRAMATYDFISDDVYSTVIIPGVATYRVRGDRLSRMGGEFVIGLNAEYGAWRVSLNYDLDLHRDYTSQTGMLKFKYNF